jgi:hypothetical protein
MGNLTGGKYDMAQRPMTITSHWLMVDIGVLLNEFRDIYINQ